MYYTPNHAPGLHHFEQTGLFMRSAPPGPTLKMRLIAARWSFSPQHGRCGANVLPAPLDDTAPAVPAWCLLGPSPLYAAQSAAWAACGSSPHGRAKVRTFRGPFTVNLPAWCLMGP